MEYQENKDERNNLCIKKLDIMKKLYYNYFLPYAGILNMWYEMLPAVIETLLHI